PARRQRRTQYAEAARGVDAAGQAEGEQRAAGGAVVMAVGVRRAGRALAWGSLLTFAAACHGPQNVLDPVGAPNRATSRLFWAMLIVSALVSAAVVIAAFCAQVARRRTT